MSTTNILDLNNRIDALEKKHDAGGSAADTTYNNTASGLTAENVQDAIDEIKEDLDDLKEWTSADLKTATGNPITLTDGTARNVEGLVVTLEPIQSGSGTPSPTNVRPITGYTECVVDVKDEDETTQDTATITFGQTVYGGSVDFKTGVMTVDTGFVTFDGSEDGWYISGNYRMTIPMPSASAVATEARKAICSNFEWGDSYSADITAFYIAADTPNFYFRIKGMTDLSAFKTWLSNNHTSVAYKLATPIELTLTPAELELLKGYNYITTNGDNIELTYQPDNLKADILLTISQLYGSKISILDGILAGGTTGQVLTKTSNDDYDAAWETLPATRTTTKK